MEEPRLKGLYGALSKASVVQRRCQPVWMGVLKTTAFPPQITSHFEGQGGCFICFHEVRKRAATQIQRAHFSLGRRSASLHHPTLSSFREQRCI